MLESIQSNIEALYFILVGLGIIAFSLVAKRLWRWWRDDRRNTRTLEK